MNKLLLILTLPALLFAHSRVQEEKRVHLLFGEPISYVHLIHTYVDGTMASTDTLAFADIYHVKFDSLIMSVGFESTNFVIDDIPRHKRRWYTVKARNRIRKWLRETGRKALTGYQTEDKEWLIWDFTGWKWEKVNREVNKIFQRSDIEEIRWDIPLHIARP